MRLMFIILVGRSGDPRVSKIPVCAIHVFDAVPCYYPFTSRSIYWSVVQVHILMLNALVPEICRCNFECGISKLVSVTDEWRIWCQRKCHQLNFTGSYWWWAMIGSGKCLVPSGIKSLPELMLMKICNAVLCHKGTCFLRVTFYRREINTELSTRYILLAYVYTQGINVDPV